jgi:hypothetical protein
MLKTWYVTIDFEDGTSIERAYVTENGNKALDIAAKEYPNYTGMGASLNPSEDWQSILDKGE